MKNVQLSTLNVQRETKYEFRLSSIFFVAQEELERFCKAQCTHAFLLNSEADVSQAQATLPKGLVPFMVIENPSWPDIYAFDFSSSPPTVVVWSDHAIVQQWYNFEAFLQWTCEMPVSLNVER